MTLGILLFADRRVRLMIVRAVHLAAFPFLWEPFLRLEPRHAAAVLHEILRQFQEFFLSRRAVCLDERELDFLVARVGVNFTLAMPEHRADQIHVFLHDIQQAVAPSHLIIRDGGLKHMPGDIQLMAVRDIRPALVRLLQNIICIYIPIRALRLADNPDCLLEIAFQLGIPLVKQAVGCALDPFGEVAVLEDAALKFALFQPGGDLIIRHGMAFCRAGFLIVEHAPLIGDHILHRVFNPSAPEFVPDQDIGGANFRLFHTILLLDG